MFKNWKIVAAPLAYGPFILKVLGYTLSTALFALSVLVILHLREAGILAEFAALQRVDPLPRAQELYAQGRHCEALEHLDYFRDYEYVRSDPRVNQLYKQIKAERESLAFRAHDVVSGVWRGKGACLESMVSATASDFLVIGDVRDLGWEVYKKVQGQDMDSFTFALAGAGVVLAAATYGSSGAAAPAKGTVSLLKVANRLEQVPKRLQRELMALFEETAKVKKVGPLKPVVAALYGTSQIPGITVRDMVTVISRSQKVSDLKLMENVARAYGSKTGKFLKLGDDAPISVLRRYGKSNGLTEAMDQAVQYGPRGGRLIERTGPTQFMNYLLIAKYGVRGTRNIWKGRALVLSSTILKLLPEWILFSIATLTGVVIVGVPARWTARRWRDWLIRHQAAGP
jgi:hypothetical protein